MAIIVKPSPDAIHETNADAHHAEAHTVVSHSDTTATGAELETLTGGTSADALHTHTNLHTEAHTVVSHSDTTATGTELETLTDGSNADALHAHSGAGPTLVVKTVDETVTSSSTLQNDDALLFAASASTVYRVRGVLKYTSVSAEDMKVSWSVPAGASWHGQAHYASSSGTAVMANWSPDGTDPALAGPNASGLPSILGFEVIFVVAGTAGNVQLQWAQVATGVIGTTIHDGSWIEYEAIS